jgi:hypothetical protein
MRGGRLVVSAALFGSAAAFVACTLDFDRYASVTGASSPADAEIEGQTVEDARTADATQGAPEGGALADGSPSACMPAASCLQQASACGATCGQQYRQCNGGCTGTTCMQGCTSTEQSCLGGCATTCIGCEQSASCPASSACLAASHM